MNKIEWVFLWKSIHHTIPSIDNKTFLPYRIKSSKTKWEYTSITQYRKGEFNIQWQSHGYIKKLESIVPTSEDKRTQLKLVFEMKKSYFEGV